MSRDHANKPNSFVPVLLAAGAALVGSIFSAAAIALDEDQAFKREEGAIFAAASVIACICWMAVVQKNVLVTKAMICSAPESISAGIGNAQSSASIWIISGLTQHLVPMISNKFFGFPELPTIGFTTFYARCSHFSGMA